MKTKNAQRKNKAMQAVASDKMTALLQVIFYLFTIVIIFLCLFFLSLLTNSSDQGNAYAGTALNELQEIAYLKEAENSNKGVSQHEKNNLSVEELSKDYTFVLFYRATCPHCRAFEPVLLDLSKKYGFQIEAITTDGSIFSDLPNNTKINEEIAKKFFPDRSSMAVPALFLVNKNNLHAYPVSEGELSYGELELRLMELYPKIIENEK